MNSGKVWLVGAGPSDAGLFTIKGEKVLKTADVVVYDRLVGQGILTMIPEAAKKINVGKQAGHHLVAQEKINQILLEEAQKGNRVVRLKGGDPFLFGRGGEEIELLAQHEIPFEIIPGVSSALAVPAYNGIPVTHRDYCSSLHIITGHKKKDKPLEFQYEHLVQLNGTLVFLMGVTAMEEICEGLIKAGMDTSMPAAVLERGTTAKQRRIVADISTLSEHSRKAGIQTPSILIVGKVCELSEKLYWYEKLPLAGCKVAVTRPENRASELCSILKDKGAEVLELPAIETKEIEKNTLLFECLKQLARYDWIVFTSVIAIRIFFNQMKQFRIDRRALSECRFAVIGSGSRKELEAFGFYPDLIPEVADGIHLGQKLISVLKQGDHILMPRAADGGRDISNIILGKKGIVLDDIPIYNTIAKCIPDFPLEQELENGEIDFVLFTSTSTVKSFAAMTAEMDRSRIRAVCIGSQTKSEADQAGMFTIQSKEASVESLAEELENQYKVERYAGL